MASLSWRSALARHSSLVTAFETEGAADVQSRSDALFAAILLPDASLNFLLRFGE